MPSPPLYTRPATCANILSRTRSRTLRFVSESVRTPWLVGVPGGRGHSAQQKVGPPCVNSPLCAYFSASFRSYARESGTYVAPTPSYLECHTSCERMFAVLCSPPFSLATKPRSQRADHWQLGPSLARCLGCSACQRIPRTWVPGRNHPLLSVGMLRAV